MTRIKKITMLKMHGYAIEYHYRSGANYRRLVIDKTDKMKYNDTSQDQVLAGLEIDELFKEAFGND